MTSADRTFSIAERAVELMRTYGAVATPRSYEVWFTFVTGLNPSLNEALRRAIERKGSVGEGEIDGLHEAHLAPTRLVDEAARASSVMLSEIEEVAGLITVGLGSAERFDDTLQAASTGLAQTIDPRALRSLLENVLDTTRDVAGANRALEMRLRASQKEIRALRSSLAALKRDSTLDPLTGLGTRKHFETTLAEALGAAGASGRPLSVALVDLDGFGLFNERFGHVAGDQVLRLVATALREVSPPDATLARIGGEQFGVLLPDRAGDDGLRCAEAIRRDVEGRELVNRTSGRSLGRITVSIGIAQGRDGDTADSVSERAAAGLRFAKASGRNRCGTEPAPLGRAVA